MCREHAAQVRSQYDRIRSAGVGVAAIGTGDARYAQAFIDEFDIPYPVLLDDDATAAELVSLRSGTRAVIGPSVWTGSARALLAGHRQGKSGPRTTQQGATFVIAPGGELRYQHLDRDPSDHAPMDEVLAAAGVD